MIVLILLIHKSSKVESIFFSIFFLAAATIPNIDQWFRVCTKMSEGNDLSARYSEIMKRLPADNGLSQWERLSSSSEKFRKSILIKNDPMVVFPLSPIRK